MVGAGDVVRAVSALFRDMATLDKQSTGQFKRDYKEGLEFLSAKQKKQMTARKGEVSVPKVSCFWRLGPR